MIQEFITSRGKVIKERDILYIRNFKISFGDTLVAKLGFPLIAVIAVITQLLFLEDRSDYLRLALWICILLLYKDEFYDSFVRRSFANRIPLNRINSFEVKDDILGLETEVILHLKNGRYKPILFRKLEKQYEAFTELLSQHIAQPQLA